MCGTTKLQWFLIKLEIKYGPPRRQSAACVTRLSATYNTLPSRMDMINENMSYGQI